MNTPFGRIAGSATHGSASALAGLCAVLMMSTINAEPLSAQQQAVAQPAAAGARQRSGPDARLQAQLEALVKGFRGDVGVYVRHLRSGRHASIRPNELFPTASMIKVPILLGTFDAIARGQFPYDTTLTFRDSLIYAGDDLTAKLRDSSKVPLAKVAMLMLTLSDNTASLWLQGLVGGARINAWLEANGFDSTRVNSRVAGREAARAQYGWGQTTPREMAELLIRIREGAAVDAPASEAMYRTLTHSYWTGEALSQLPPWVQAASKQGAVNRSRSEVVLVNGPSGDYVFTVITKNQLDESWTSSNEGYVLIRQVSALLWKTFEPARPYAAPAASRYAPPAEP